MPLLKAAHGGTVNSHTFISFSNAIQQTYAIARALSALRPELAPTFQKNAADYARRLRAIKSKAAAAAGRCARSTAWSRCTTATAT